MTTRQQIFVVSLTLAALLLAGQAMLMAISIPLSG